MKTHRLLLLSCVLVILALAAAVAATAHSPLSGPWTPLDASPGIVSAWAASPDFAADRILFSGTQNGLYRSPDAGQSWTPLGSGPGGPITAADEIAPSPAYGDDGTLFVRTGDDGSGMHQVLRSSDDGATWQVVWSGPAAHDLAVSPAFAADRTLFLAAGDGTLTSVQRSLDGGDTWTAVGNFGQELDVYHLALSPAFAADHTLFAGGYGRVHRSTDGGDTWQALDGPNPTFSLAVSPHFATDRTVWISYREIEGSAVRPESSIARSTDGGDTWTISGAGLPGSYLTAYFDLAAEPGGEALYAVLDSELASQYPSRVYRSTDGGQRWAPQPLLPGDLLPDHPLVPGPLPDLYALGEGAPFFYDSTCFEAIADGGIETDPDLQSYAGVTRAWSIPSTAFPAGYAMDYKVAGAYSMRTGTDDDGPNVYSYSSFRQAVSIPAGATQAELTFYRYPILGDAAAVGDLRRPAAGPPEGLEATGPGVADFQYLLALFDDGSYDWLAFWRSNDHSWLPTTVDLSAYAGRSFRLHFGTFNNGTGGPSGMFVDEIALSICGPRPFEPEFFSYLPLIARSTGAPAPTPTATPAGSPTPIPTATPATWPTPHVVATLTLPAGSRPHGIDLDTDGTRAYVALHGSDHSGRTLAILRTEPLQLLSQVPLNAGATGPNGVDYYETSAGAAARIAVANRQTSNAAVVDAASGALVLNVPAALMPDGVIVQGNFGYIANYGSHSVTLFDPAGLTAIGTLNNVGQEPSLFAADPATGDVYLSAHGSNQVARLRDGITTGHFDGIPAPYGLAIDPAGRRLYVANRGIHHTVTVIDLATGSVAGAIDVGKEPYVLAVNPDSGHLFVACGDEVKVFSTLDWSPVTSIPVPAGAEEGIVLDSGRDRVYVTSGAGDAVTVIQDSGPDQVLFVSNREGSTDLYRMLPDGREVKRLTVSPDAYENAPAGSPDGRWIAFERRGLSGPAKLWVMSRDGRNARQVTFGAGDDLNPTWSPDGRQLAFASDRDGDWEIWVLELATGALTQLTDNAAADLNPDWSWSNGRIAFQSNRVGPNSEIFTMAADGSDVRRVTVNPNGDAQPSWSPLADRIAFWGTRAEQTLYVVPADGGEATALVSQALQPGGAAWSLAGEAIVFQGYRPESGHSEILRVQSDGSGLVLLTRNEVDFDYAAGWLPGH